MRYRPVFAALSLAMAPVGAAAQTDEEASESTSASEGAAEEAGDATEPASPEAEADPSPQAQAAAVESGEAPSEAAPSVQSALVFGSIGNHVDYTLSGSYRVSFEYFSDMRVDPGDDSAGLPGRLYGQNQLITHRLTFEPSITLFDTVSLQSDVQLATGFLTYDDADPRFTGNDGQSFGPPRGNDGGAAADWEHQLRLRKLYLSWTTSVGQLRVGRMASHWGLGILANSGDDERLEWGSPRFGKDRNYGDIVNRVLFITKPLAVFSAAEWAKRWVLAAAGDIVERDERTQLTEGDLGLQAIGVLLYQSELGNEGGIYVAHRNLKDEDAKA